MNIEKPETFLGQQADSPSVIKLMEELGLFKRVKIPHGDTDVYLNNHAQGISLLFESERYARAKYRIELPTEAPLLTAIFVYGNGNKEFSPFSGDLVKGLTLSDGRDEATHKLGKSEDFDADMNSEMWVLQGGIRLYLDYSEDESHIVIAQIEIGLS